MADLKLYKVTIVVDDVEALDEDHARAVAEMLIEQDGHPSVDVKIEETP